MRGKAVLFRRVLTYRLGSALVAALLLVLQTTAGAFASGAGAASVQRDAFGNPLCITSGDHAPLPDAPRHDTLPGCCTLACAATAAGIPPSEPPGLPVPFSTVGPRAALPALVAAARPRLKHSPANPRAPPPAS